MEHQGAAGDSRWELSKENIQPLKGGRNAGILRTALASDEQMDRQKFSFEEELRTYSGDDPLDVWFRYLKWMEQACPSGKESLFKNLLQKCLKTFGDANNKYKNDLRWLYIWQKYALLSSNMGASAIYEHMFNSGNCTNLAGLYIQWSQEAENAENFPKASQILRNGISQKAQPIDKLNDALSRLEERLAARMAKDRKNMTPDSPEETRQFLGVLKGVGAKQKTPFMRPTTTSNASSSSAHIDMRTGTNSTGNSVFSPPSFDVFTDAKTPSSATQLDRTKLGEARMSIVPPTSSSSYEAVSSGFQPVEQLTKENVRQVGVWQGQQVAKKRHTSSRTSEIGVSSCTSVSSSSGGSGFNVYKDSGSLDPQRRRTVSVLKSKHEEFRDPILELNEKEKREKGPHGVHKYCHDKLLMGNIEVSFEELRAMIYKKKEKTKQVDPIPNKPAEMLPPVVEQLMPAPPVRRVSPMMQPKTEMPPPPTVSAPRVPLASRPKLEPPPPPMMPPPAPPSRTPLAFREMRAEPKLPPPSPQMMDTAPAPTQTRESCSPTNNYGNTSLTRNVYKEAMKLFSDTLPQCKEVQDDVSDNQQFGSSAGLGDSAADDNKPFSIFLDNPPPPIAATKEQQPFEIFVDPVPPPALLPPNVPEEDKENAPPADARPVSVRRPVGSVFGPAKGVACGDDDEDAKKREEEAPMDTDERPSLFAPPPPLPPLPSSALDWPSTKSVVDESTAFDANEPTLARFGVKAATYAVASTPYVAAPVLPPTLSAPWEDDEAAFQMDLLPASQQNSNLFAKVSAPAIDERQQCEQQRYQEQLQPIDEGTAMQATDKHATSQLALPATLSMMTAAQERRLSTIAETSREFRSGSSCPSSVSSTNSAGDNRRVMASLFNSGTMTSEQRQLTFSGGDSQHQMTAAARPTTPSFSVSAVEAKPAAVTSKLEEGLGGLSLAGEGNVLAVSTASNNVDCDESCERTGIGLRMNITSGLNPWDPELIAQLLMRLPKRLDKYLNWHRLDQKMPAIKVGKLLELGGEQFKVDAMLGEGAFARVYKLHSLDDVHQGDVNKGQLVIKVQKPACPWEFYICEEMRRRLTSSQADQLLNGVMQIHDAFIYEDGSVLTNDYLHSGTILDLVNRYTRRTGKAGVGSESLAIYFLVEILRLVEVTHSLGIIHADIKPDNFLVNQLPGVDERPECLLDVGCGVRSLKLIDWGRAIDMTLLPTDAAFRGSAQTSAFECCEMRDGRPWTYQTDYYGVLGTCHVLLFGTYMTAYKLPATGEWRMNSTFKRKWNTPLWKEFFATLLNVGPKTKPDLADFRRRFQNHFRQTILETGAEDWVNDLRCLHEALAPSP